MKIHVYIVAAFISLASGLPQFYRDAPHYSGGSGSYAGPVYSPSHNSLSKSYSNLNGYNHDFGYDVQDPKYQNYQGRQESGSGDSVRGSYYLMEADGSMRRVDYVADHPGGFRAVITDKHGSKSYGDSVPDYGSASSGGHEHNNGPMYH